MPDIRCPTCGRSFNPEASTTLPFCGERCRLVDLGHWLEEDYGMPYENDWPEGFDLPPEDSD